jgi:EAL domain-containing protein (putative c-di-GMP-specific phosphodiesterase class I)/GGDEF domain-containing protein/CBS domain-containing protein
MDIDGPNLEREVFLRYLASGEIRSYFQPIVDLYTGRVFGYEMLVRGSGRLFSPAALFAEADRLDLGWELEYACRRAALNAIAERHEELPGVSFFINVSPNVFTSSGFRNGFTVHALKERGIDGSRIVLEITETTSVSDYTVFDEMIRHYVAEGFHIALDDFGAGHSGLITLVAITPHYLKLDRELVKGIHRNHYKQGLVKHIATFADSVGSHILGEGIETEEELNTLLRLGARYGQGFFFGRPASEPRAPDPEAVHCLARLGKEYRHSYWSLDFSLYRMVVRPETVTPGTMTCNALDLFFSGHNSVSHIVVVDESDHPLTLITRQYFYSLLSGRYGFSVFQRKPVDAIAKRDFLIVEEGTDLRVLSKLAMGRPEDEVYDPVVVVDDEGKLSGTITMKQLLAKAFDVEVKFAVSANPLTQLPGNMVIRVWLEDILHRDIFTIIYADLDKFKEYNDSYGFSSGDDMIKLLAELLQNHVQHFDSVARLGHVGGDDFIVLVEGIVDDEQLLHLCEDFDRKKESLFRQEDIECGCYHALNRIGEEVDVPLVTVSLAVVTNENFLRPPHPGKLGQSVALLKRKIKERNAATGRSGFLRERRVYDYDGVN